jgi:integrase
MNRRLPRYVSEFEDRHGKMRVRFRRTGFPGHYFRSKPWTPEFMAEYQACLDKKIAPVTEIGAARTKPGSISALIVAYYKAPEFLRLKESTRIAYRNIIERFREAHGDKRVATIERQHIKAIIGQKAATPPAANNLLDRLKGLMAFAVDIGMRKDNPTLGIRGFREDGDGVHSWSEDEIGRFEAKHPVGTRARLAMALLLYTGQRRSDVVVMGRQHIIDGSISVCQQKTAARLLIPLHPALSDILDATPADNLTFLMTGHGKPFTAAGFGNWFRECCNEAGLKQCSAHGLRKAASRRLAEAGCSNQQIKAITGHKTDKEVARYTAAADQARLAKQAMDALTGAKPEQNLSTRTKKVAKNDRNPLNRKGA